MTFVSLAQATRRLGIDAKTLHRWLQEAPLPLQSHPVDGRKKGLSEEHLQQLSRLHHRHLASSEQEEPAQLSCQITTLPADLLSLPEQLSALQAQIAALQQQVADLTHLLTQPRPQPTIQLPPTKPPSTLKPPAKPTRSAPRSRPAATAFAKTPRQPTHVIPRVEDGEQGHSVVICPKHGWLPFEPDTQEWFAWVAEQDSFRGCRENRAISRLIMSGGSLKGPGAPIAISATTTPSSVLHPTTS